MADVKEMPVARKVQSGDEWLQWTVNKKLRPGDTFQAAGHSVTVERIVEVLDAYSVALVSVAPGHSMRFDGDFGRRPIDPLGQR